MRPTSLATVSVISFLLLIIGMPQLASAAGKTGNTPIWAGTNWQTDNNGFTLRIKYGADGKTYHATVDAMRDLAKCSGKVDPLGNIVPVVCEFENWQPRRLSGTVAKVILQNNGSSGGAVFEIAELDAKIRTLAAKGADRRVTQQASNTAHKPAPSASSSIPYRPLPVGTRLIYGPKHETIVVKKIEDFETLFDSSKIGSFKRFGKIVQINRQPYSPTHGNLEIGIDKKSREKIKTFWNLKVGNSVKYNLEETWNDGYDQLWALVSTVKSIENIKVNNKFYSAVKIVTNGISTENSGSNWAENGRKFLETIWIHPNSGVLLKFERKWSGVEVAYGHPSGHVEELELVRVEFPEGSKVALNSIEGSKPKSNQNLASSQQPSSEARKAAEAERSRLQQEIAELKKQNEEARRLAEAERKRRDKEKLLAEAERKNKAKAKRIASLERKRKDDAKRLAEVERKRKAEAKQVASLEKKRKAEEAKKRKVAQQTASAASGSGELEQQLGVLKRLRANGLINEQEFAAQKKSLLVRFLGFKSAPSTKVARAVKPKNTELKKSLAKYSDVKFGNYHALVIGSNDYKYLPKLKTAKTDAKAVAKTLKSKYGYKVKTLLDASRLDILDAFDEYRETLTKADNLLVYYAGHGFLDEESDSGYWMPVDARPNRRGAWLSNAAITSTLKALKANHVMVMADSCYSGTLTRGLSIKKRSPDYAREAVAKKARVVITSGGLEPVADKSGGAHSPFASVFLDVLNSNNGVLDGTKLFNKMRRPVMLKADQTPAYSDVRKAGHEGGDFLFVRRR